MEDEKWINLGDLNFFAYGGCLVKPHQTEEGSNIDDNFKYVYDVFYLNTEAGDSGDKNFAALCVIDLQDSWLEEKYDEMLDFCGYDEYKGKNLNELIDAGISPEVLAKEMVEYLGVGNFSPIVVKEDTILQYPNSYEDFLISDKELNEWLKELDAEEHCVSEEQLRE
jgi:hypothetical protein